MEVKKMPRRNENARPRMPMANGRWHMAELRAMSEHIDGRQKAPASRGSTQDANLKSHSTIKTTPESIVRDFRRTEGFSTYETAGAMRPLCRKVRRPFFLKRWYNAVNWDLLYDLGGRGIEWACIGALIACLIYLGIFVFGPFTIKLLR
jgi:hypothetical protein